MMIDAIKDKGDEKEGDEKETEETMKAGEIKNWIRWKVERRKKKGLG